MGGSGFLGSAVVTTLRRLDLDVTSYGRSRSDGVDALWMPQDGDIDMGPLSRADVVINVAGENLASGRWTAARKQRFIDSRVAVTSMLSERLAGLDRPPELLINTSAVGIYGDRGEAAVTELSEPGTGFLADLCQQWEGATAAASAAGIRVALPRFGVILGPGGGALDRLVPLFRTGLGGRLGSGEQFMPWITLTDAVGVIRFIMRDAQLAGPVNAVAPERCRNADFTEQLARAVSRPAVIPAPAFALRAGLGEMAQELLLTGANARPRVLEQAGFRFEHPRLADALHDILRR